MGLSVLAAIVVVAAVAALFLRHRRQSRLTFTQQSVRCPLNDCPATLVVQSDPAGYPSRRHVDVTACSLLPPTVVGPLSRAAFFADMAPPEPYLDEMARAPWHSAEITCSKPCLHVLNAAESGASLEPVRCTSGVSDAMELVRQTQGPAISRLAWIYSS